MDYTPQYQSLPLIPTVYFGICPSNLGMHSLFLKQTYGVICDLVCMPYKFMDATNMYITSGLRRGRKCPLGTSFFSSSSIELLFII